LPWQKTTRLRRLGKPTAPAPSNAIRRRIRVCFIDVFVLIFGLWFCPHYPLPGKLGWSSRKLLWTTEFLAARITLPSPQGNKRWSLPASKRKLKRWLRAYRKWALGLKRASLRGKWSRIPKAAPCPNETRQYFAISRHASPRGGFLFQARNAHHSLKSPVCSCVSIKVASFVVNTNHGIMWPAAKLCVVNCVAECVSLAVPEPTKWQRILDGEAMKLILDRSADVGCYRWSNAR